MFLKYEEKCPRCGNKFINIVDGDTIFDKNYNQIGKMVWYRCVQCNNVFGYYILHHGNETKETKVIEISLNNS